MTAQVAAQGGDPAQHHEAYVVDVGVRWSDQDPLGHVNHAVVVELMAEARMQWLSTDAVAHGYDDFGPPKVVASLSVDYRSPVEYGTPLSMAMHVTRIGTSSYTLSYRAIQDSETRSTGSTVIVPRECDEGGSRPVTARERDYLSRFLRADAG